MSAGLDKPVQTCILWVYYHDHVLMVSFRFDTVCVDFLGADQGLPGYVGPDHVLMCQSPGFQPVWIDYLLLCD